MRQLERPEDTLINHVNSFRCGWVGEYSCSREISALLLKSEELLAAHIRAALKKGSTYVQVCESACVCVCERRYNCTGIHYSVLYRVLNFSK